MVSAEKIVVPLFLFIAVTSVSTSEIARKASVSLYTRNSCSACTTTPSQHQNCDEEFAKLVTTITRLRCGDDSNYGNYSTANFNIGDINNATATPTIHMDESNNFELVSETVLYSNWRKLISRKVRMPYSKKIIDFEVVGSGNTDCSGDDEAVLIIAWNTKTKTMTLIREYMPSAQTMMYGVAAGNVELNKHGTTSDNNEDDSSVVTVDKSTRLRAAKYELEEEARLVGGVWIPLTPNEPVLFDKYCTTRLSVYLVLDAVSTTNATSTDQRHRDAAEEGMEIVSNVTLSTIHYLVQQSKFTVVVTWAILLALNKLREINEI